MGKFTTDLDVRVKGNRDWELITELIYVSNNSIEYIVPIGTKTDFASVWKIPLISTLLAGKCNKEATLHDYFYRTGCIPRMEADQLFKESILSNEVTWKPLKRKIIATLMYLGVRLFAKKSYNGRKEWSE